jgi:hypothetical protein
MPATFSVLLWVVGGVAFFLWLIAGSWEDFYLAIFGVPIASFALGAALHQDLFGNVFGNIGTLLVMIGVVFCAISTGGMVQAKIREGLRDGRSNFSIWHCIITVLGVVGDIISIASLYKR